MSRRRKRHWDKEKQNNKQGESQNSKPTEEVIKEKKVRIPVVKDVTNRCSAVFNQFICVECYRTNAIIENKSKVTPLYKEKNIYCNTCSKKTTQICIKDKIITKANLELTSNKTEEQNKTYKILKKSNCRSNK